MTSRGAAPARLACGAGAILVVVTTLVLSGGGASPTVLALLAWALAPYAAVWLLLRVTQDPWVQTGAALGVLLGEAYIRGELIFVARGSTSALVLLFSPFYLLVLALPVGAGLGWAIGRGWRRGRVIGRGLIVTAAVACAAVAALAIARPAALPFRLGAVISAKERIGPPRVVAGETFFTKTRLSSRIGWYDVGGFGATPADTIASVTDRVVLLDPATGAEQGTLALAAQTRRQWNWFSRLVRDGGELLLVQTGGGYSEVEVLDLEGRTRWRFRPHPALPPIALLPRDLDGDGRPEFYAASKDSVYRLDATGKVVWARAASGLVNALDADGGIVVAVASGGRASAWDAAGNARPSFTVPGDAYRYRLVDWPRARSLVGGAREVRVVDLEGRRIFEQPLGDFVFVDALVVRLDADGPAQLAVTAAAPREVGVGRLMVFSASGAVVYDEILPRLARMLAATDGAARRQVLLLADGHGLLAYRR